MRHDAEVSHDAAPLLPALSILFFCSGASALIYQILWLRMMGLVFGVTIYAVSTAAASFMGRGGGHLRPRRRRSHHSADRQAANGANHHADRIG